MSGELVPATDLPDHHLSGQEVPQDDLHMSGDEVPAHDLPEHELQDKYSTSGQTALTAGENFAKGLIPFGAQYAENKLSEMGVPGISPEEQSAREQANPTIAAGSKIAGNVGMMMVAPEIGGLSKLGGLALNNAIQMGTIASSDEYSKAMMGHADPTPAVAAHIIGSTALGGVGGILFGKVSDALVASEGLQMGSRLQATLAGFGHSLKYGSNPISEESALQAMAALPNIEGEAYQGAVNSNMPSKLASAFTKGQELAEGAPGKIVRGMADVGGGVLGSKIGHEGLGAFLMDKFIRASGAEKLVNKSFSKVGQKYFGPAILKIAQSGKIANLAEALDYAGSIGSGAQVCTQGMNYLFNTGSNELLHYETSDKERDKIKEYLDQGGVNSEVEQDATQSGLSVPAYAHGGHVAPNPGTLNKPNAIADHWPEQNILINATRGRISQYLTSKKPVSTSQFLFDSAIQDPQKEKEYNKAIDLINKPMSILKHIKQGTILPSHVDGIKSVYPELYAHLSTQMMERLMNHKLKGEKKPPYKMRQALSLFLGGNVDGSLSQPNIMAAQSVFAGNNQQEPPKSSETSLNKMSQNVMTNDQSREESLKKY